MHNAYRIVKMHKNGRKSKDNTKTDEKSELSHKI
jgi:hypothetical protein